jgi:hypothetical protein
LFVIFRPAASRPEDRKEAGMKGVALRELVRRLENESYIFMPDQNGRGPVYCDGDKIGELFEDGRIEYPASSLSHALYVRALYDEVDEYTQSFRRAEANPAPGVDGTITDARVLLRYNGCDLTARRAPDGSMDFTVRDKDSASGESAYLDSYAKAKEDFAIRAGLIDARKLISETELLMIRSGLAMVADITPDRGPKEAQGIRGALEDIGQRLIPELYGQEQLAAEMGHEPEIDM